MQQTILTIFAIIIAIANINAQTLNNFYCKYDFNSNTDRIGVFGTDASDYNTATAVSDRFGNANSAYHFTATSNEIITYPIRNFSAVNNDSFSISCWVKLESSNSAIRAIMAHYYSFSCGDNREYVLNVQADDSLFLAVYEPGSNPGYYTAKFGQITDTLWHHVVATYKMVGGAAAFTFYLDGNTQSIGTTVANPTSMWLGLTGGSARAGIGNMPRTGTGPCTNNQPMNGAIDDIYFYSKVLTPSEVMTNYNAPDYALAANNTITYVDINATGASTGESWTDAYTDLNAVVALASAGDTIFVAEGVYPTSSLGLEIVANDLTLFGGFGGSGWTLATRDWRNHSSIIDGDVANDDVYPMTAANLSTVNDNAANVLEITARYAEVDGFVIRGGRTNAIYSKDHGFNSSNITLRNCEITQSTGDNFAWGVGLYVTESNSLTHAFTVENCSFHHLYGRYAVPFQFRTVNNTVMNVNFINNLVHNNHTVDLSQAAYNAGAGGGFSAFDGSTMNVKIINSTFAKNTHGGTNNTSNHPLIMAGEELGSGATLNIDSYNSIYWANSATKAFQNFNNTSYRKMQNLGMINNITVDTTDSSDAVAFVENGGLQSDPMFVDTAANDFDIQLGSPAIEAGTSTGISSLIPGTDFAGGSRVVYSTIDMGAYENQLYSSLNELEKTNIMTIYPNPTNDILNIETKETIESIQVYTLTGLLVKTITSPNTIISLSDLMTGIYLMEVRTDNQVYINKITKE